MLKTPPEVSQKKQKSKKNQKNKEKHQNVMKKLQPSAFTCNVHTDQYLKLKPNSSKNPPTCKSCGFKLESPLGYLTCPKLSNCYHLCSTCKVCSQNHILRQLPSLKHLSNTLSAQNKYKCKGCQKLKQVQSRGVWHCNPCNHSICPDCMQRTDELWSKALQKYQQNES